MKTLLRYCSLRAEKGSLVAGHGNLEAVVVVGRGIEIDMIQQRVGHLNIVMTCVGKTVVEGEAEPVGRIGKAEARRRVAGGGEARRYSGVADDVVDG